MTVLEQAWQIALWCGIAFAFGCVLVTVSGFLAIGLYPDRNDARRSRKRFTTPALLGMICVVLGGAGALLSLIVALALTFA